MEGGRVDKTPVRVKASSTHGSEHPTHRSYVEAKVAAIIWD